MKVANKSLRFMPLIQLMLDEFLDLPSCIIRWGLSSYLYAIILPPDLFSAHPLESIKPLFHPPLRFAAQDASELKLGGARTSIPRPICTLSGRSARRTPRTLLPIMN